jgi:hypothetical protein
MSHFCAYCNIDLSTERLSISNHCRSYQSNFG